MNNCKYFCVTATPEAAIKKLARANIAVYGLKKRGREVTFGVNEEYTKKVFAIFAHPCYNISIGRKGAKERLAAFVRLRAGLIVGSLIFLFAVLFSGSVLFRIKITGSGQFLKDRIYSLADECGAREWTLSTSLDAPLLRSKILSLPGVSFCTVKRSGAYLLIDVQTAAEDTGRADASPLKADRAGKIVKLTAVCGTPEKNEGDNVLQGDVIIGAYSLDAEGTKTPSLAVGYADIECEAQVSLFYAAESRENAAAALAATALYSDRIIKKSYKVSPCDGGVVYTVSFTFIKTLSVNMQ